MENLKDFRELRDNNQMTKPNFLKLLKFYSELYLRDKLTNGLDAALRNEMVCWAKATNTSMKKLNTTIDSILDGLFTSRLKYEYVDYSN